jgi:hypothetical protein
MIECVDPIERGVCRVDRTGITRRKQARQFVNTKIRKVLLHLLRLSQVPHQ